MSDLNTTDIMLYIFDIGNRYKNQDMNSDIPIQYYNKFNFTPHLK